jgi:hypothetical protein
MKKLVILFFVVFLMGLVSAVDCTEECLNRDYFGGYCSTNCSEIDIGFTCEQQSLVNLIVSTDSTEVYNEGGGYIGQSDDDPLWLWHLDGLDTEGKTLNINANDLGLFSGPIIGIKNNFYATSIDSGLNGTAVQSYNAGDTFCFPEGNYICIQFLDVTNAVYDLVTIEKTSVDLSSFNSSWTSKAAIYIFASVQDSFKTSTSVNTDKFWIVGNDTGSYVSVYYEDSLNAKVLLGSYLMDDAADDSNFGEMDYNETDGTAVQFDLRGDFSSANALDLVLDILGREGLVATNGRDDLAVSLGHAADSDFNAIGSTASLAEAAELVWDNTNIGIKDEDHLSLYGIQILDPSTNGDSDKVKFNIPSEQVKVQVKIYGEGNKTQTPTYNYDYQEVGSWQELGEVVLASEVTSPRSYNLILVGGPCANPLVTAVFGLTCNDWSLEEGEGIIKLVENGDNYALLLAGTTEEDTERVYNAMLDYENQNLSGLEFLVSSSGIEEVVSEGNFSIDDYPWPFIVDYDYNDLLVVFGDMALSKDVLGAVDIMYQLQNTTSYELIVENESLETELEDSIIEWIALGNNFTDTSFFSNILEDDDLEYLHDNVFNFLSEEIDYKDMLVFFDGGPTVHTGLTASEDAYGTTPYIEVEQGELRYYISFDDTIDPAVVTPSDPLEFRFLGEYLTVSGFESGNKLSLESGTEYFLNVGDTIEVGGVNISVDDINVAEYVSLKYNGTIYLLSPLEREQISSIYVKNQEALFHEGGDCCCMDVAFY